VGPQTGNIDSPSLDKDAWLSSRLPGVDVVGDRDSSWSCLRFIWLYLAAKPSHLGSDMDGLACSLHRPMVCGWLTWVQSFLIGAALSHRTALGGGTFLEGANPPPPELDIYHGVADSYVEKLAFTRACLSSARVIMMIMRVPLVE
jgi:hypothetical protein